MRIARRGHLFAAVTAGALAAAGIAQPAAAQTAPDRPTDAQPPAPNTPTGAVADTQAPQTTRREDEVVVTARRREESNQNVPAAVTAIGAATLQKQQIATPSDLQRITPSLSIGGGNSVYGSNSSNYAIRGLGQALFGGASVISYFGEAPFGPTGAGMPFFDIASVQVLKGPQGTLFGRASVGGAVVVTPQAPTFDSAHGLVDARIGNLGRADFDAVLNLPVNDMVGLRVALNRTHLSGYVRDITTGKRLSGINSQSARVSVKIKPFDGLENTTVYNLYNYDAPLLARILVGANTNLGQINRPASAFTTVCTQAVTFGLATDVASCQAQRVALEAAMRAALAAEVARTSKGGDELRRFTGGTAYPQEEKAVSQTLVNTLQLRLPEMGALRLGLKDVFSIQKNKNIVNGDWNGTPYYINASAFCASPFSPNTGCGAQGQFVNGRAVVSLGRYNRLFTNEGQLNGSINNDDLIFLLGYYYQNASVPYDTEGSTNLNLTFAGINTPNLGPLSATPLNIRGNDKEHAYFGQFTLDLGVVSLDNVHVTAGYRKTRSHIVRTTAAATYSYPSGRIIPGALSTTDTRGSGPSWNVALDWKATPDLLLYATRRRGYKPGGQNTSVGASTVPGYVAEYLPEKVIDTELGVKWDFTVGGLRGRLNADVFRDDYTNIQRGTNAISSAGNNFAFTANVAAARLQGVELEGFIEATSRLTVSGTYSFIDSKYTKWRGSDPLGAAPAGSIIDLSNNPFANAPRHKASITVDYDLPVSGDIGTMRASVTGYGQTRSYFTDQAQRNIEVYGAAIAPSLSDPGYVAFNARFDWRSLFGSSLDAALYARNLGNRIYAASGGVSLNSVGTAMKIFSQPREVGMELIYHLGQR